MYFSKNITPDSLSGMVFALEGLKNSVVILNSPTGCKFYHSAVSDYQYTRQMTFDPLNYPEEFYFGQPQVPCTYLDSYDYVYGSREKLEKLMKFIKGRKYDVIAIINSPGAALIGDDLEGIVRPYIEDEVLVTIESPGYSNNMHVGYSEAVRLLLESLELEKKEQPATKVNLIGISIYNKFFKGDIQELREILSMCNIDVNCVLCADTSLEKIKNIGDAALNVVVYPEFGLDTAEYLKERLDMPYFHFEGGLPVGFDATEKFIKEIAEILGMPINTFIENLERARGQAFIHLSRLHSLTGLPRNARFSISGPPSSAMAYSSFFVHYLGMLPEAIDVEKNHENSHEEKLKKMLEEHGLSETLGRSVLDNPGQLLFADGNTISQCTREHDGFSAVEIDIPSMGIIDIIPKTHFGIKGSLYLIEQIINRLPY